MQTAGIRSLLEPEYEFEFVEGRWPHLEGNWSLHTVDFSKSNVSLSLSHLKWCYRVTCVSHIRPLRGRSEHKNCVLNEYGLLICAFRKLYGYYNGLDIEDILATENELREVIEEHGPFDGLLGYS